MAVQREELGSIVRGVSEDDDPAVVERRRIVRKPVNSAAQGGMHWRSRVAEDVEPEVDRPTFIERTVRASEQRRAIEQAWLIVPTNRDAHARLAHRGVDACRDEPLRVLAPIRADEWARNAQVEHEDVVLARI